MNRGVSEIGDHFVRTVFSERVQMTIFEHDARVQPARRLRLDVHDGGCSERAVPPRPTDAVASRPHSRGTCPWSRRLKQEKAIGYRHHSSTGLELTDTDWTF